MMKELGNRALKKVNKVLISHSITKQYRERSVFALIEVSAEFSL